MRAYEAGESQGSNVDVLHGICRQGMRIQHMYTILSDDRISIKFSYMRDLHIHFCSHWWNWSNWGYIRAKITISICAFANIYGQIQHDNHVYY